MRTDSSCVLQRINADMNRFTYVLYKRFSPRAFALWLILNYMFYFAFMIGALFNSLTVTTRKDCDDMTAACNNKKHKQPRPID